ncbi:MAG: hypothetical protein ACE5JR_08950 [Gemmatimonadota bacterium]
MRRAVKNHKKFLGLVLAFAMLNVGLAFQTPEPAIAQQCPTERSDCSSGVEVCTFCSGCICWACGRDCGGSCSGSSVFTTQQVGC